MIELACIAEGTYLRHAGAMLHSVLAATPGCVSVNILHRTALDAQDQSRLTEVTNRSGAKLNFLTVPASLLEGLPGGYFSQAVWLRIFLPELLPHLGKMLYLDSDLIAADDVTPLWEINLGENLLAAVVNPVYPFMPAPYPRQYLGLERPEDYFNSGVLLMNLARMREEGVAAQLKQFALEHPRIPCPDQDALNMVCRGRWLRLHPRWNLQPPHYDLRPNQLPDSGAAVLEGRARPAIIHFTGSAKPWHYLSKHPRKDLYFQHARDTPWGEPNIDGVNIRNFVLKRLPLAWTFRLAMFRFALVELRDRLRRRVGAIGGGA